MDSKVQSNLDTETRNSDLRMAGTVLALYLQHQLVVTTSGRSWPAPPSRPSTTTKPWPTRLGQRVHCLNCRSISNGTLRHLRQGRHFRRSSACRSPHRPRRS
jgi:hypothetical protein